MRHELREIANRINENRLDWREVMQANEAGWRIGNKVIQLTKWELEILRKLTKL